jgi:hypothetical protein
MVKTFKIGEYIYGGIVRASVKPYMGRFIGKVELRDYNTNAPLVSTTVQMGLSHSMEVITSFLEGYTTHYYAEQVSQWIESSYLKQKP